MDRWIISWFGYSSARSCFVFSNFENFAHNLNIQSGSICALNISKDDQNILRSSELRNHNIKAIGIHANFFDISRRFP